MRLDELNALAKRTRLIINCVGPYHLYSTPVVEACATNGTHYVDVYVSLLCWSRQLPLTFVATEQAKLRGSGRYCISIIPPPRKTVQL